MGTKRKLTPIIGEIVEASRPGAFLDAFAGMCSVGTHIGSRRPVWSNDLQSFSNHVSTALFCSAGPPPGVDAIWQDLEATFERNFTTLKVEHQGLLTRERLGLLAADYTMLRSVFEEKQAQDSFRPRRAGQYDLFTERYAGVYFSTEQCIEIDSFRFAADSLLKDRVINSDCWRWLVLALAVAMNRCSSSTGHFAQPLAPKAVNIERLVRERSRSIVKATLSALYELQPIGDAAWRTTNRVFQTDAATLLTQLPCDAKAAVVYADPPYTADHYSRYYHLYETLVLYDYPPCFGRGRYRGDRAISDFCLPSKVEGALEALIRSCANASADLVLSYPENGLLQRSTERIPELIRSHYGKSPLVRAISHAHSTMGASKGSGATTQVIENIYKAAA